MTEEHISFCQRKGAGVNRFFGLWSDDIPFAIPVKSGYPAVLTAQRTPTGCCRQQTVSLNRIIFSCRFRQGPITLNSEPSMRNILFDLDGTLTDSSLGITRCIQYALEQLGRPAPAADDLLFCIGPPLIESFATLLPAEPPSLAQEAVLLYRQRFDKVGKF